MDDSMTEAPTDQEKSKKRNGFTMQPNCIWDAKWLKPTEKLLWQYLNTHSDEFNPSIKKIHQDTGLSRATTISSIRKLESYNMIVVERPRRGSNKEFSKYFMVEPSDWTSPDDDEKSFRFKMCTRSGSKCAPDQVQNVHSKNTNKNTKKEITTSMVSAQKLGNKEDEMFKGEFPGLVNEISRELTSLEIKHQHRAVEMAVGAIIHNYGWDVSRIKEKLPEAIIYLIEAKPKNVLLGLINFYRYYREPAKQVDKPFGSDLRQQTTGTLTIDDIFADELKAFKENSNVIDFKKTIGNGSDN